jgi:O-antigen ligase
VTRTAILALPLIVAYIAVGWSSPKGIFKPVSIFRSIVDSDEETEEGSSTNFRHLENFNLVQTWRANPVFGSGFGHEYDEVILLPDISRAMPTYRYQPHNGALWLWTIGGVAGFSSMWLFIAVAMYFAARAYHRAPTPLERSTLLTAISAAIAYVNQVYGDMGAQSYTSVFILAMYIALTGQLAMRNNAWKEPKRMDLPGSAPVLVS